TQEYNLRSHRITLHSHFNGTHSTGSEARPIKVQRLSVNYQQRVAVMVLFRNQSGVERHSLPLRHIGSWNPSEMVK
ncbi:hypothetical protein NHX12_000821, partial [Muraenolepis orangiensis]